MPDADFYDSWYTDIARSPRRDDIVRRALGLPDGFESTSLLCWEAVTEVTTELRLGEGGVLLDQGCGRGGYGLEIIRRTGASLVGVDFSAVAVGLARRQAETCGLDGRARHVVRDMTDTGLKAGSIDAVLSVDAIQFTDPLHEALAECRRVLRPGGRLVLTAWQALDTADEQLRRRMYHRDYAAELDAAGFDEVRVVTRPAWRLPERAMWEAATSVDVGDDPALRSMRDEGRAVLETFDARRRVLVTASAPA